MEYQLHNAIQKSSDYEQQIIALKLENEKLRIHIRRLESLAENVKNLIDANTILTRPADPDELMATTYSNLIKPIPLRDILNYARKNHLDVEGLCLSFAGCCPAELSVRGGELFYDYLRNPIRKERIDF